MPAKLQITPMRSRSADMQPGLHNLEVIPREPVDGIELVGGNAVRLTETRATQRPRTEEDWVTRRAGRIACTL